MLYLGIDIGTGGVRALAVDAQGDIHARAAADFNLPADAARGSQHEQPTAAWVAAFDDVIAQLKSQDVFDRLSALCIDGTSGTVVPVDAQGNAAGSAIMYNDSRSGDQAKRITELSGQSFSASHALPKILWLAENQPDTFNRTARFISQSDYLAGRLTGRFDVTDYSNALKTGYDLVNETWPAWIAKLPGVRERLATVVASGDETGRAFNDIPVIAGCTDGTAGFLASGASNPGDYNTTLGTTLVVKGLSSELRQDPDGLIYSHKLPGGVWLPGAASSTGGEWISAQFPDADLKALDATAEKMLPVDAIAYPLVGRGERFPFRNADAEGFCEPNVTGDARFAANLQGTALLERLAYDTLNAMLGASGGDVYATGGGARSDVWMQCRADVTGRTLHRPTCPEAAFGSAVLAAAGAHGGLQGAIAAMVCIEKQFTPNGTRYDEHYATFLDQLRKRNYL